MPLLPPRYPFLFFIVFAVGVVSLCFSLRKALLYEDPFIAGLASTIDEPASVLLFGDSVIQTAGFGDRSNASIANFLEAKLHKKVLDASRAGLSLWGMYEVMKLLSGSRPKVQLAIVEINLLNLNPIDKKSPAFISWRSQFEAALGKRPFWRSWLRYLIDKSQSRDPAPFLQEGKSASVFMAKPFLVRNHLKSLPHLKEIEEVLCEMASLLATLSHTFFFFITPIDFSRVTLCEGPASMSALLRRHKVIMEAIFNQGLYYLDLSQSLNAYAAFLPDKTRIHLSELGREKVADALAAYIQNQNITL